MPRHAFTAYENKYLSKNLPRQVFIRTSCLTVGKKVPNRGTAWRQWEGGRGFQVTWKPPCLCAWDEKSRVACILVMFAVKVKNLQHFAEKVSFTWMVPILRYMEINLKNFLGWNQEVLLSCSVALYLSLISVANPFSPIWLLIVSESPWPIFLPEQRYFSPII